LIALVSAVLEEEEEEEEEEGVGEPIPPNSLPPPSVGVTSKVSLPAKSTMESVASREFPPVTPWAAEAEAEEVNFKR